MSLEQVGQYAKRLNAQQRDLAALDSYYDGSQAISFISPEIRRLVGDRLTTLIINWPAHVLDSLENRLDVEGFRLGSGDADADLWATWQANEMDVESQVAHLEAMLYGRTAVSVWPEDNRSTTPVISVETPRQVLVDYAPGTRKVRAAYKQWQDGKTVNASLFLPDRVEVYQGESRSSVTNDGHTTVTAPYDVTSVVKQVDEVPNPLGAVPFVPLVNRRRTSRLDGQSELSSIIPLADAVNKLATDMMVASEFYAEPRRALTGLQLGSPGGEGADARARLRAEVEAYIDAIGKGRTIALGNGADIKQLAEANLSSFVSAIEMLTNFLGAIGVLPPHYMGISTKNPASADAIRSAEGTLTKRALRKQRPFGGSWETVQRYARSIQDGVTADRLDPKFSSMETVWADPETQTISQLGDFAQKMVEADIMAIPTAQEWIGMSPQQRERDITYRKLADPMVATQARLALARELMRNEGVKKEDAFAQAGLTEAVALAAGFVDPTAPAA